MAVMTRSSIVLAALVCILAMISMASMVHATTKASNTLVLLDSIQLRQSHSLFFQQLIQQGHKLTFKTNEEENISLMVHGHALYDALILFTPTAETFASLKVSDITAFMQAGHNVLVAADHETGVAVRALANECGIDFDDDKSLVVDHFRYDTEVDNGHHQVISTRQITAAGKVITADIKVPVLFSGIAHSIKSNDAGQLVLPVLTGNPTTHTSKSGMVGRDVVLVSAIQARNNARITFAGSLSLFSDEFLTAASKPSGEAQSAISGNEQFAIELARWTFQEKKALRTREMTHFLISQPEAQNPHTYRVNDVVQYSIIIEEYNGSTGEWVPFEASDVQLELVMLDPYIRTGLSHAGNGVYKTVMKLPDLHGVYQFKINYNRAGYSVIQLADKVKVRHIAHDEFERFIDSAYPYYASSFSMMIALFVFSIIFLFHKSPSTSHLYSIVTLTTNFYYYFY